MVNQVEPSFCVLQACCIFCLQVGKELGGGHQGAVYELLDGKGKDSGQVLKVS